MEIPQKTMALLDRFAPVCRDIGTTQGKPEGNTGIPVMPIPEKPTEPVPEIQEIQEKPTKPVTPEKPAAPITPWTICPKPNKIQADPKTPHVFTLTVMDTPERQWRMEVKNLLSGDTRIHASGFKGNPKMSGQIKTGEEFLAYRTEK